MAVPTGTRIPLNLRIRLLHINNHSGMPHPLLVRTARRPPMCGIQMRLQIAGECAPLSSHPIFAILMAAAQPCSCLGYQIIRGHYVSSPLSHTSTHSYNGNGYGASALPSGLPQDPTTAYHNRSYSQGSSASPSPPLFDPLQPGVPHANVMAQFIQIFFQRFGQNFPFLHSDDITKRFYNGTLSPVLASSIAALASRCVGIF